MLVRKKPVVVEAMLYDGTPEQKMEVYRWIWDSTQGSYDFQNTTRPKSGVTINPSEGTMLIMTLEGEMKVSHGDYVIRGVNGEFYPCKPDIFKSTYETVYGGVIE